MMISADVIMNKGTMREISHAKPDMKNEIPYKPAQRRMTIGYAERAIRYVGIRSNDLLSACVKIFAFSFDLFPVWIP